jgi:hypothetical protein
MFEETESVLRILRCTAFSFSPEPRLSGFLSVILYARTDS